MKKAQLYFILVAIVCGLLRGGKKGVAINQNQTENIKTEVS